MVPVPIIDLNEKMQSYTHLQVAKPYAALNSETYILLRNQELRICKYIAYELYCEEFFVAKHKSKYICESAIYIDLGSDIIKENCNFIYFFNNANTKPVVLDGGNKIILKNRHNKKHIECNISNYIPVKIPILPYVLLNRSILCNYEIEAEYHFLLELLAACQDSKSELIMYFTVNLAFINYFDNLIDSLTFMILLNRTTFKQILQIYIETLEFKLELLKAPKILKDLPINLNIRKKYLIYKNGVLLKN